MTTLPFLDNRDREWRDTGFVENYFYSCKALASASWIPVAVEADSLHSFISSTVVGLSSYSRTFVAELEIIESRFLIKTTSFLSFLFLSADALRLTGTVLWDWGGLEAV